MSVPHHRFELNAKQVAASALAAASAAVAASTLGVAGTVIGAAVMSVVATVGSAVYGHSIARTQERLRRVRSVSGPQLSGSTAAPRRVRPLAVAGTAAIVFAVAVASLTLVEVVGQRPVASMVAGDRTDDPGAATTLGRLTSGSSAADEEKRRNDADQPAGADVPAASPSAEPSPSASPTAGGDTPTPTPSPTPTDPPVSPQPTRSNPPSSPAAAP